MSFVRVQSGSITTLFLNRPEVRNAFNAEMIHEITRICLELQQDSQLRAVVLRGEGEVFCAGADMNWMKSMARYSEKENRQDSEKLYDMFAAFKNIPVPTVALVQGAAMGGGLGLIAAADIALAEKSTRFCFSEVKIGLAPAVISSFVAAKVSKSSLQRYFLTGEVFTGDEAKSMGLVQESLDLSELESSLQNLLLQLRTCAPQAVRSTKKLLRDLDFFESPRDATTQLIARLRVSDEGQEGLSAFLQKRKPKWVEK